MFSNLTFDQTINLIGVVGTILGSFIGFAAVYYAYKSILNSSNNTKKQIIVVKIEEIYEITFSLFSYYDNLLYLYDKLKQGYDADNLDLTSREETLQTYRKYLEEVKSEIHYITNKTSRLKVLADVYLDGELKKRVLCYGDFFEKLANISTHEFLVSIRSMELKISLVDHDKLHAFLENLEEQFVKLISISQNSVKQEDLKIFRETIFEKELGLDSKPALTNELLKAKSDNLN